MKIERMNTSHVAQVAELERIAFSDPWSEKSVASELNNPLSLWLVAQEDGRVSGYVGSQTVMGETDMMNIAVHPEFRRCHIAEALVTELIRELRSAGSSCLTLEVRASNTAARSLYDKLGFVQIGERPNYYRHPRENAIILRKELEL